MVNVLVTGAYGFIGSALVRRLMALNEYKVVALDKMGYASSVHSIGDYISYPNFSSVTHDLGVKGGLLSILHEFEPDCVLHLAAESHVDNSINSPEVFVHSNILGTFNLLEAWREYDKSLSKKFIHVSTDEVFGELLSVDKPFDEASNYRPNSPYSASKAASDHLVRAWHKTYQIQSIITNCSNNFGPFQSPEKFIPKVITSALLGQSIPVYGNGKQIRDWLYVDDHVSALILLLEKGRVGESYVISAEECVDNLSLAQKICNVLDIFLPDHSNKSFSELITFVSDRPGHDFKYALDPTKIKADVKWTPNYDLDVGLSETISWYIENSDWWRSQLKLIKNNPK
ncbi:dTDP-glucose 4,6-dehydratase [Alphaproteobacteria bacterium]|nr:dTDP-glucose 4,6-dehydratase [Alphaproteobacteria bacterium]